MPETIEFGGESWAIEAFTLRQIRQIVPALNVAARGMQDAEFFDACAAIIAAATDQEVSDVMERPTSAPELAAAVSAIARVSGLIDGRNAAGEASAGSD